MNRYSILYFLTGTRGGINRIEILRLLQKKSLNANEIKDKLKLDYKTVQHHLRLLVKNRFIQMSGNNYGAMYHLTEDFKVQISVFKEILAKVNKSPERD
ncbi:MAG: winged helix-turn-helix domain-containing protein [Candidatus Pacearchaeota archaeon]